MTRSGRCMTWILSCVIAHVMPPLVAITICGQLSPFASHLDPKLLKRKYGTTRYQPRFAFGQSVRDVLAVDVNREELASRMNGHKRLRLEFVVEVFGSLDGGINRSPRFAYL